MSQSATKQPQLINILLPLLILIICYWAIYFWPVNHTTSSTLNPEQSRELWELSRKYLKDQKLSEALQLTLELNRNYPTNHIYIDQLADIYHLLKNYREEAATLEKFINYAPNPGEACPRLGEAYRRQYLLKENLSACQRCFTLDPHNLDNLFFLARAYEIVGDYTNARSLYQQGVTRDANYLDMSLGIARIELAQGQIKQAQLLANDVLKKNADYVDALLILGIAAKQQGQLAQAKQYLQAGLQKTPRYLDFYLELGEIAEAEAQPTRALDYYQQALKIEPANTQAIEKIAALKNSPLLKSSQKDHVSKNS